MPVVTSGGGLITSQQIVNGTIVNEDINPTAAIALSKLLGVIADPADFLSISQSTSFPTNVVVDGKTRILVIGKGTMATSVGVATMTLEQDGVVKDTIAVGTANTNFALAYTEVPTSGTKSVNFNATSGSYSNLKLIIIKLKIAE